MKKPLKNSFKLEPVGNVVDWRGGIDFSGEQIEDVDNQRNAIR